MWRLYNPHILSCVLIQNRKAEDHPVHLAGRFWGQYQYIDPTIIRSMVHVLWHASTTEPDTFGAAALHWLSLDVTTLEVTTLLSLAALTTIFNPKPSFGGDLWPLQKHSSDDTTVMNYVKICGLFDIWHLSFGYDDSQKSAWNHGNNGGWCNYKKAHIFILGTFVNGFFAFLLGHLAKIKWKHQQSLVNWQGNFSVCEEVGRCETGNGRMWGEKQEIK